MNRSAPSVIVQYLSCEIGGSKQRTTLTDDKPHIWISILDTKAFSFFIKNGWAIDIWRFKSKISWLKISSSSEKNKIKW